MTDKSKRGKINEIVEYEEGITMASEVLMTISKDEIERAQLMSEFKYQMDLQSKLVYAEQKGFKEGEQIGEQRGEQKGEQKIIDLLKSGMSPEDIILGYDTGVKGNIT